MPYERQLAEKAGQVDDALRRIGGLDGFDLEPIEPAVERVALSKQARVLVRRAARASWCWASTARGSWAEVIDVEDCLLASERNNAARNEVREWARAGANPAPRPRAERGVLRNLVVREGVRTGQIQTRLVTSPASFAKPPVDLHTVVEGPGDGPGPTGALGEEHLDEELAGLRLSISHTAFFQTNTAMAERLYGIAGRLRAGCRGRARIRPLLRDRDDRRSPWRAGRRGLGDRDRFRRRSPTRSETPSHNGISNARFVAADARLGVRPLLERAGRPDVVVVDPPRAGLSKKVVRRVIECGARRIVYVSCNPTTLAPNAAQLAEAGYTLRRVKPLDMFPQTPHVECVRCSWREQRPARHGGFGVAAGLDPEIAAPLADRCEELGYSSMWSNDHPGAQGLDTASAFAEGTDRLELGVAVIALDRHKPAEINARIDQLGLDRDRLWIGLGRRVLAQAPDHDAGCAPGASRGVPRSAAWSLRRWGRRCAVSPAPDSTERSSTG